MNNTKYNKIAEIIVHSQSEMNDIPSDFTGRIYIECTATIVVDKNYYWRIVAWENSSVEARGNSSVVARGNSSVVARGNSSVEARENSSVVAWENSSVEARENSSVEARGNSSVVAWRNSSVEAWENSSVVAWENSSVEAWGNSQIVNRQISGKIKLHGNAREVFMPKTVQEFMDFYDIQHTRKKAILYKAVRKNDDGILHADYNSSFKYTVGEVAKEPDINRNTKNECGYGIHIAHLNWALDFGKCWDNLTIIEVEVDIDDIVMPVDTNGKVRVSQCKVLREIPLEECGLYGKILAKRHK